jgi:hypothetical protein
LRWFLTVFSAVPRPVARLAGHLEVGLLGEGRGETLAERLVVVHE